MKVQVNVQTLTKDTVTLNLTASPEDTVQTLKERIALAEPNPFPENTILLGGKALRDSAKLSECGVEDGGLLDFHSHATEEALAKQLEGLLPPSGAAAIEELGLLYSLRHGVTVGTALQALGKADSLQGFLERQGKVFAVQDGLVRSAKEPATGERAAQQGLTQQPLEKIPEDAAVQRLSVTVSVAVRLPAEALEASAVSLAVNGADTVGSVKERVAASALVPFADQELLLNGSVLPDGETLAGVGVAHCSALDFVAYGSDEALARQLAAILKARGPSSRVDLDNLYCCRHGVSASEALRMLGWGEKLLSFLQRHPFFAVQSGCVSLAQEVAPSPLPRGSTENQKYLDLHAKLCDSSFSEQASHSLDLLAASLSSNTFLNVRRAAAGGALAKGTAIPGAAGAEVVLFLEGLPHARQDGWLRGLPSSVAAALSERMQDLPGVVGVQATNGTMRIATEGQLGEVRVFFSPEYQSYSETLEALRKQDDATRKVGVAAFVAQKVRFVERQPEAVKATMRLMKWWRQQRQWTSESTRPSDELLELVVAHTAAQQAPRDLCAAVSEVLATLARFDDLNVSWPLASRCYRDSDVWKPLLKQRPLLLDPTNPLVNLADPQSFQPHELIAHARSGSFFL